MFLLYAYWNIRKILVVGRFQGKRSIEHVANEREKKHEKKGEEKIDLNYHMLRFFSNAFSLLLSKESLNFCDLVSWAVWSWNTEVRFCPAEWQKSYL